jgi:restriction system protein
VVTIPDYQTVMLPLLNLAADGKEHRLRAAIEELAEHFNLTEDERKELLPSGSQATFDNRVGVGSHLYEEGKSSRISTARLLPDYRPRLTGAEAEAREDQRQVLGAVPRVLGVQDQEQHREHDHRHRHDGADRGAHASRSDGGRLCHHPQRACWRVARTSHAELSELLRAAGRGPAGEYGLRRHEKGRGGGRRRKRRRGIDGIIKEDRLGLEVVYIQAKRWKDTVGRPEIQRFVGALHGQNARKGVFITTSGFSNGAIQYADGLSDKVVLIDGETLANLMIDHGVGVALEEAYEIKRVDSDYFNEA